MAKKKNTPKMSTKKNEEQPKKQILVINPIDALIRINASETVRERILSQDWFCQAYVDCMELLPDARALINKLRERMKKGVEVYLESPYDEEIIEIVAVKFRIPYTGIRCTKSYTPSSSILQVEMRLRKLAS